VFSTLLTGRDPDSPGSGRPPPPVLGPRPPAFPTALPRSMVPPRAKGCPIWPVWLARWTWPCLHQRGWLVRRAPTKWPGPGRWMPMPAGTSRTARAPNRGQPRPAAAGTWLASVTIPRLARDRCGYARQVQSYRPGLTLRHLIDIRHRTCGVPRLPPPGRAMRRRPYGAVRPGRWPKLPG